MSNNQQKTTLYHEDYVRWVQQTIDLLKSRNFDELDLDNLINEVAYLAQEDKDELQDQLIILLELAIKRQYIKQPDDYKTWELAINRTQKYIKRILKDSPSLKYYLIELLASSYETACSSIKITYNQTNLPDIYPFSTDIEQVLNNKKFWNISL